MLHRQLPRALLACVLLLTWSSSVYASAAFQPSPVYRRLLSAGVSAPRSSSFAAATAAAALDLSPPHHNPHDAFTHVSPHGASQDHHPAWSFLGKRHPNGSADTRQIDPATFQLDKQLIHTLYPPHVVSAISLTVSPSQLCTSNATVTVTWAGVPQPDSHDWIGLYSPADALDHDYLDYFYVTACPTYKQGECSVDVPLLNMRESYQLRYFRSPYTLVATSNDVSVCQLPLHGRIALTGDITQMRVSFITNSNDTLPTVHYGLSPDALTQVATGTSHTYAASDMCGPPSNVVGARLFRDPGYIHDVLLTGLQPNTLYYYDYGNGVRSFTSAPQPDPAKSFRFITYGDMGAGYDFPDATGTANNVEAQISEIDFVLHVGDISYGRSIGYIWEKFGNLVENIATQVPYMVGVGNHEYDHTGTSGSDPSGATGTGFHPSWGNYGDDSNGECAVPLYNRFHMPDNGNSLFWYSFDYGSAHIVHFSSEHDFAPSSEQYAWLKRDLAAVDRTRTPWLIVAAHRPMYTSENYAGDYNVAINMRRLLEDLFVAYNVDLAIYGHYHAYERSCAVVNEVCQPPDSGKGTVHIVVGTAGASLDDAGWMDKPWSAAHAAVFGYGRVSITADPQKGTSQLLWEFVRNVDNQVVDSTVLTKSLGLSDSV